MAIYISQLLETKKLIPILNQYDVGLEVISFGIGNVLDNLECYLPHYEKEFAPFIKDIPIAFHGPFVDLAPGSCDQKVLGITKERFEGAYQAANYFKVNKLIYHVGYVPKTYPIKYWLENAIIFWEDFVKDKLENTTFHIENVLEEDCSVVKELIDAVQHPHFSACLDVGHIHANARGSIEEWAEKLGSRIGHVHLHNNRGIEDTHSGILDGTIDIENILVVLQEVAPKASWTLEVGDEEGIFTSLEWLDKKGFLKKLI